MVVPCGTQSQSFCLYGPAKTSSLYRQRRDALGGSATCYCVSGVPRFQRAFNRSIERRSRYLWAEFVIRAARRWRNCSSSASIWVRIPSRFATRQCMRTCNKSAQWGVALNWKALSIFGVAPSLKCRLSDGYFSERVDKIAQGRTLHVLYRTFAPQGRVSIISYVARGKTSGRAIVAMEAFFPFIRELGKKWINK